MNSYVREIKQTDRLLIVDDDENFLNRLDRAMQKHGFQTLLASSIKDAMAIVEGHIVTHAILDLRLEDGNGLDVLEALHAKNSDTKIVMLTGYGAIATAVAAMKLGAAEYLSKPSTDPDDILNALLGRKSDRPMPSENPMSADRVKWEHIQRVYEMCDRNVSETARQLNMHRRTLQRILAKRAPNE